MTDSSKNKLVFAAAWLLLSAAVLAPIWSARTLPILDLPVHLALVRAWHSLADPRFGLGAHFAPHVRPSPYLLYYALVNAGMYVVDIETANKLLLSVYVLSFALALASCARRWVAIHASRSRGSRSS